MTHYRMLDRAPSVMITSNRNELKLYQDNTVYLNDGDNFELRFFNPLQQKVGVEIMFNGIKKGDAFLVLNPGQDLFLDRFLDEQRKMLFETYVIDGNSKDAVEAIAKNGIITFNFYKEAGYYNQYNNNNEVNINYNFPPKPPKPFKYKAPKGKYRGGTSGWSGSSSSNATSGCAGPSGAHGVSGISGSSGIPLGGFTNFNSTNTNSRIYNSPGVFTSESDMSFVTSSANINYSNTSNLNQDFFFPSTSTSNNERGITLDSFSLETGRIEMGDISKQTLKSVNAQFQPTTFHTVTYQILPYSAMNRTIGEVRQYCPHCSYRVRKSTWLYCPKCGESLD